MRKTLSLILALALSLSLLMAGASAEEGSVTLTFFHHDAGTLPGNILDNPIMSQIEERTGVVLDWSPYMGGGTSSETASLLIASEEYPDIWHMSDTIILNKLQQNGLLLPLNDLIGEHGQDIVAIAGKALDLTRFKFQTGDENYFIPIQVGGVNWYPAGYDMVFSYRYDIFKESGMDEITTYDQLLDFLAYAKENHPETADGLTTYGVGMPLGTGEVDYIDWNISHNNGADVRGPVYLHFDTDTVTPRFAEDGYFFEGARFYFDMNQRGLFDPESATMNGDQVREKGGAHRYFLGLANWQIGWPNDRAREKQEQGELEGVGYVPLVINGGEYVYARGSTLNGNGMYYALSATCKDPVSAMKMINYLATWEGAELCSNGPEGELWEYDEQGNPHWFSSEERQARGMDVTTDYNRLVGISFVAPNMMVNGFRDNAVTGWKTIYSQADAGQFRLTMSDGEEAFCDDYGYDYGMQYIDENFPYNTFETTLYNMVPAIDPTSDLAVIQTDMETLTKEYAVKLIYANDQAQFDAMKAEFLGELEFIGYEQLANYFIEGYETLKAEFKGTVEQ